uniref:Uncharacterized protein n=1 Tax=Anguilla anguilla TaxID=7936 RepID=A0A0E9UFL9_ANGAN
MVQYYYSCSLLVLYILTDNKILYSWTAYPLFVDGGIK